MRIIFLGILWLLCLHNGTSIAQSAVVERLLEQSRGYVKLKKPDSALHFADIALQNAAANNNRQDRINAMTLKGKALFNLHKEKEGVALYFEALSMCRPAEDKKEIAALYGEIGFAYYAQQHIKEAKSYYQMQLSLCRSLNSKDSLGNQLVNLAVMHDFLKEYDSAIVALNEVADILSRTDNIPLRGYYYINRGAVMEYTGRPDSAEIYYLRAYDAWKLAGNEAQMYKAIFNIGFLYEERGNHKEALKYYHKSMDAAERFGFKKEVAHVYGTMAEAYAALHDYKNAYDYLYKYAMLQDSLSKSDFNNYVVRLDKQFEGEKNRQTIQDQQLKLETANVEVQKQRNKVLLIILVFTLLALIGIVLFGYVTIRSRVQKKVDEAKSRFFANVAHEIRTPLSMIQGPVKTLQSKITDPEMVYQLDMAERNTNRLNELINQMLDISKIDAAKYKLEERVGNVSEFLETLVTQYVAQAREKNIKTTVQVEPGVGNVMFDKDALEKVVGNLLSNAIKYTPDGGSVGIEVGVQLGNGRMNYTISVWDTGPGIALDDQQRIFDRFYRTRNQENAGTKGIGIGLSLVQELVGLMKGDINIVSEPGQGAVFTVTLSFAKQQLSGPTTLPAEGAAIVLLVEDDKDILDFNRRLLQGKGYKVITATNGVEALAALADEQPDIVVTDIMMPVKDGITLLKELKADMRTRHIPVVALSAKASAEAKMEAMGAGAQAYMVKPFLPDELAALVANLLDMAQLANRSQLNDETAAAASEIPARPMDPFARKCLDIINERLDDAQLSVELLAELMNVNRSHFQRKIKALTGFSPSELIRTIRLEKAQQLLRQGGSNITETAYATGFTSQSYFTKCFTDHFGYPPSMEGSNEK